jgi:hypothetical protein
LEFVAHRRNWGEDRVYCRDEDGELFSLPAAWTNAAPVDPFVVIAAEAVSLHCRRVPLQNVAGD